MFKVSNWLNVNWLKMVLVVVSVFSSSSVMSQTVSKEFRVDRSDLAAGVSIVDLSIITEGAAVNVSRSSDPNIVLVANVDYEATLSEPEMVTRTQGNRQVIELHSRIAASARWDIVLGDHDFDTDLSLILNLTAFTGELGGLPLRNLSLVATGDTLDISFSEPTKRRVDTINGVVTGTISNIQGIGQTDFGVLNYSAAGATSNLDFSGEYGSSGDHTVFLVGTGSAMNIMVPKEAGEQVTLTREGAPVRFVPASEWTGGISVKRSVNYNEARERINFWAALTGAVTVFERR